MVESPTCLFFVSFKRIDEKKKKRKKNQELNVLKSGMTSIPSRYTLLGVTL